MHGQGAFRYTYLMPSKTARKKGHGFAKASWKDIQSKRQITQKTKLALIVLCAVLTLLFVSQAVKFTQMLFSPWRQSTQVKRTYFWSGDFKINILIRAKGLSLLSFNPKDQKITMINIPKTTYLEVAHGFGKWQMDSIYDLGGAKLLKDTLVNLLGLPLDGILDFSGKYSEKSSSAIVSEVRKDPFSILNILPYLKTDLTPFELIRLKVGLSGVRFDKIKQIDLEKETDSLQKEKLADGTDILTPDTIKLDAILSDMADPAILSEHKTIAIFNSTDHPGLAQKAARLITNIGGYVIITSNGQNRLKATQVLGEKSKTIERIKQIFKAGDIIHASNEDLTSSRAEINLFLGEDFFDQL